MRAFERERDRQGDVGPRAVSRRAELGRVARGDGFRAGTHEGLYGDVLSDAIDQWSDAVRAVLLRLPEAQRATGRVQVSAPAA